MKKTLIALTGLILLGLTQNVKAQFGYGKPEDIEQVKKRKLIVIVEKPDEGIMKKLTKKNKTAEIKEYESALNDYNNEMKEVVEKFWDYSTNEIEYKSAKEVENIKNKAQYTLVYCSSSSKGVGSKHESLVWFPKGDKIEGDAITMMAVCLAENNKPIYSVNIPDPFPTKADLVFGLTSIDFYFNYRVNHKKVSRSEIEDMIAEYQPRLKHKTLLMRQDQLDSKITPEQIKEAYPFQYRIVTADEMDQYVINTDSNYAYAIILPAGGGREVIYVGEVFDCKDGTPLGMSMPSMGAMMFAGYTGGAGHSDFTKKTLADFCKYITEDTSKKKKK